MIIRYLSSPCGMIVSFKCLMDVAFSTNVVPSSSSSVSSSVEQVLSAIPPVEEGFPAHLIIIFGHSRVMLTEQGYN